MRAALPCQAAELGPTAEFESALGFEQPAWLEPVEGGVQRAVFDEDRLAARILYIGRDPVAVARPCRQGFRISVSRVPCSSSFGVVIPGIWPAYYLDYQGNAH